MRRTKRGSSSLHLDPSHRVNPRRRSAHNEGASDFITGPNPGAAPPPPPPPPPPANLPRRGAARTSSNQRWVPKQKATPGNEGASASITGPDHGAAPGSTNTPPPPPPPPPAANPPHLGAEETPRTSRLLPKQKAAPGVDAAATSQADVALSYPSPPLLPSPELNPRARGTPPSSGRGSASPASSGHSSSGTTSGSSSSTRAQSYLSAATRGRHPDSRLRDQLYGFLKSFSIPGSKCAHYKAQIAAMKVEGVSEFRIEFGHLLTHSKEAAIAICNQQSRIREIMLPVMSQFLREEGFSADQEVLAKVQVLFSGMPQSIKLVMDFIKDNGGKLVTTEVLAGNIMECTALPIGLMLVQRSAAEVFRAHVMGLTFDGDFGLEDIVVINEEEVRITKIPKPGDADKKVKDVHRLGDLFMPRFKEEGRTALYFAVLEEDLKSATSEDVTKEWFHEYILGHPALRPSAVRFDLIGALEQTCSDYDIKGSTIYDFLKEKPSFHKDWREIPADTENVVHKVYWFRCEHMKDVQEPL